jgi:hypothetical protein
MRADASRLLRAGRSARLSPGASRRCARCYGPGPASGNMHIRRERRRRPFRSCRCGRQELEQDAPQLESPVPTEGSSSGVVLCLAGRTSIDQAACAILAQLVEREHLRARVFGPDSLSISGVSRLKPDGVEALCIFYLGRQRLSCGPIFCTPRAETIPRRSNSRLLVGQC